MQTAQAAPEGGQVIGGSAAIDQNGTTTTIQQNSDRAIIRWDSFDLAPAERVRFQQPSRAAIAVNRIADTKPSQIDGALQANGNVVLINPNGIVFGSSAVVDVGGLIATTSDLKDDNAFLGGGPVEFTRPGNPDAKIINRGTITAGEAGLVGLIAPHVENSGVIRARLGKAVLASGDIHTIDFAGDGLIKIEISDTALSQSITNSGLIEADGGSILLTAAQARHMVESLITNTGTLRATTVQGQRGQITLSTKGLGDVTDKGLGSIINTGIIIAEAAAEDQNRAAEALGGDITVLADAIRLGDGSFVSAAGDAGGGTIRIGGDYQGGNDMPTSTTLYIDQNVILNARSRRYGKGGTIILWSDERTTFYGNAYAMGGDEGGNGGLVEVSGKNVLHYEGHADLRALHGASGTLLLDPTNITISSAADAAVTGSSPFTPDADNGMSVLNATTLQNALASANVIVQTRASGAQPGNIIVDSLLTWNSGTTLTLDAHGTIIVNQAISGGSLTMIAGTDVQFNAAVGGTGTLALMPAADATTIGVGNGAGGTFNINSADFPFIQNGWSDIIIGRATGTGAIDLRTTASAWNDNLTIQSNTGTITVSTAMNVGTNDLTFITNGDINLAVSNAIAGTGTLNFRQQSAAANVGLSGAAGALNLTATEIGRIADGWAQINIGRADGAGNMTIGTSNATWKDNVTFHSGTGAITVSSAQTFGANNLAIITDGDLTLSASNALYATGGTFTLTQRSPGTSIGLGDGQTGDITLSTAEVGRLRDGFTQITIGRADSTGAVNIGNSTWVDPLTILTGTGAINVNASTLTTTANALSLTTGGGNITIGGTVSQTTAALTLNSGGGNININAAMGGTTTGAWNFDTQGGALTISGNITKTGGSVSFNSGDGEMIINNALSFAAAASSFTTSGGAGITLNSTLGASTGTVTMTTAGGDITLGGTVTFTGAGALNVASNGGLITTGAITQTTGALSLLSQGNNITVSGTLTKTGGTATIDSGAGQITLNTVALGAGSLALTTDSDIILNGNLSGTGAFSLTQASDDVSMAIGTGETGTVMVDDDERNRIQNGWSSLTFGRSDSTGGLTVKGGFTWNDNLVLQTGTGQLSLNGSQAMAGNNLTLRTDSDIHLGGALSSGTSGSPSGTFALVQASTDVGMGLGDGQAGTVHLSNAELAYILDGWSSRVFGRTDSAAALNVGAVTWPDPVSLRTGSGQMNLNGAISMGANALTLSTDSDLYIGANVIGSGSGSNLTITVSNAATSIGLGDGQAGDLILSNAELGRFGTTWSTVTIGSTAMTGAMNVAGRAWSDPLTLRTGSGQLNLNGNTAMGGNNLTLTTDSDLYIGGTLAGTGTLTITPVSAATSIGLGDGQAGILSLTDAELNNITNGWGGIIIGTTSVTAGMNVGARTWNDALTLRTGNGTMTISGAQNMAGNNLTLTANSLAIEGALSGTGVLSIFGANSVSIGVGSGQAGTLSLSDAELDLIQTGWSSVVIGGTGVSAAVNIAERTWNNSMDFRTGSGALNINGAQNMGVNNLILRTATDLAINYILAGTGNLSIMNSGTAAGNTMAVGTAQSGQLKLTDAEIAYFAGQGWNTLAFGNSSSAGALNVDAKNWSSHVVLRNGAGNLNINGTQNMEAGKNLTLTSNGDLVINHALAGSGILTFGPSAATASFGVGDGTGGVNLSNAELARIGANWNQLVFGTTATTNSTYGTMTVANLAWNHNVKFLNNAQAMTINGAAMGAHNLSIETNAALNINGNLSGTGVLSIAPQASNTSIGVGGTGTLNLNETELQKFVSGWDNIIIGRADGTGAMNISARTWDNDITFMSGSGIITIAGAQMGANDLAFITNGNLAVNGNLSGTGALTIRTSSGLTGIGVGDGQTGALALSNTELGRITDGWDNVTIGGTGIFGKINIGAQTWAHKMTFVSQGDIILNGVQSTTEGAGTNFVFATTAGSFINNAGVAAIDPGAGRYLVYSVASAADNLGGLIPLTVIDDESYASYSPAMVTEPGDVFIYSGLAAKIVFISLDDVEKAYGDNNPVFTYTYLGGLQGSDSLNDVVLGYTLSAPGSTVLDSAGTTRTITGSFTAGLGYTINVIEGLLTVIKALITVTADSDTREYGEANPALSASYSGFKNGEDISDIDTEATVMTSANMTSNAGDHVITASGAFDDNYDFIYVDGTLTVTKALLTGTTQNATRAYGDSDPAFSIIYTGYKNGDHAGMIDTAATITTTATATSGVGAYGISAANAFDNNYSFAYVNSGLLSITKATLTATTQNATRAYGDANPAFDIVYTGFKNGETDAVINTKATAGSIANETYGIGTYSITASGAFDDNYSFAYANTGILTIEKAMITVKADDKSRIYGEANPALTLTYSGFKNGQDSAVLTALATAGTAATALSDAGAYAITASGAAADNYDFTYAPGTLTIGKALLTATISGSGTRAYGDANPAFALNYTGFVNGDDESGIDILAAISAPGPSANAGMHEVTASGAFDNNYIFTYIAGSLDITKATLTATADSISREAGAPNPPLTVTYTGFKNGENSSVIDTPATATTNADGSAPEGDYIITAAGAFDNNYDFIYADGTLTVTPASQTPVIPAPPPAPQMPLPVTTAPIIVPPAAPHGIFTARGENILSPRFAPIIRTASSSGIFTAQATNPILLKQGHFPVALPLPGDEETLLDTQYPGMTILPDDFSLTGAQQDQSFLIGISRSLIEDY